MLRYVKLNYSLIKCPYSYIYISDSKFLCKKFGNNWGKSPRSLVICQI